MKAAKAGEGLDIKCAGADSKLMNEPKWPCLKGRLALNSTRHTLKIGNFETELADHKAEFWLFVLRKNLSINTAKAYPVPGIACLVLALKVPVQLLCFPIKELLARGIGLKEYPKFIGGDEGSEFVKSQGKFLRLGPGDAAYVPMGYMIQFST